MDYGDDLVVFGEDDGSEVDFPSSITNSPPRGISRTNESTRKLEADIELLDSELYASIQHRAKLLCRSARISAELATQLAKDNTTLLRHKVHRDARITKRQINLGGPLTAGDANRIIRARESKEQVQEERRLKKRISKPLTTEDTPTPAPRFIPWIPPMDDISTI
ncbi:hypothetical protein N7471_008229 [Penicillium samsonianum]|uniref:uncharacterized protein n=1 Tax=Penicillium samsonianum TaxID=1882272 RepID=UPI0025477430|nr:uncharacterized protein N7471_013884 [Penicillium samsonianum]XP_057129718.1 uncharacterized protein N7471_013006 [Penicillium samsonianum]XP_057131733.1 uncharacterized protein N7471_012748 [Penicillium samsonianum]XP_057135208.1 uncharacterized protein N7471_008229 [Penicillium samsonianum]KAJ6118417.1 hypothetical protein N7471_013884 [Penicillium samsonianum]KAJ6119055.1 hypothetical protein N7471_013006 [Penicillium samsonianum]KAJ6125431.1 hypothetical protein N7471_012748 [Penicilli